MESATNPEDTTLRAKPGQEQSREIAFLNPVIRGFNPDPTICVVPATGEAPTTYYLSTSTFEYFPGCAIYRSTNLVDWELLGHALTRRSQLDLRTVEPGAGSWASTLRYRPEEKRWYLANGVFHRYRPKSDERIFPRGFYVWTDNILDEDSWSDPIYFDNPGFDQDLFWDDDGKVYLSTTHRLANRPAHSPLKDFAIHVSQIDLSTGRTLTPPVVVRQSPHGIAEGSHILKRNEWYYLLTAEGGTEAGHQEWVFRSREGPYGPWEGQGKALWYNSPDEEVQRTGHADVFEDGDGHWWAVLLGVRPLKTSYGTFEEPQLGRETFLVKVDWVDEWPVFNDGKNISILTAGRYTSQAESRRQTAEGWRANLALPRLDLGWYHKNTPLKSFYTLLERPGYLRLYGGCYDMSSPESPSLLLRKQTAYTETFRATLDFRPSRPGYQAGVVLWWSQYSYATIGLCGRLRPDGRVVASAVVRQPPADSQAAMETSELLAFGDMLELDSSEPVQLSIEAQAERYTLLLISGGRSAKYTIGAGLLTVSPPVGGAFAGMMFGIYSFGKGEPVIDPADFSAISITR